METLSTPADESSRRPGAPGGPGPCPPAESAAAVLESAVRCADGRSRCPWALSSAAVLADHDDQWGRVPDSVRAWFRALTLELLQAGLAPGAAVSRLASLEAAFAGFDPVAAAQLDDEAVDELLLERGLIRNRAKLTAVVLAARAVGSWEEADWAEVVAAVDEPGSPAHVQAVVHRLRQHGIVHAGPGTAARLLARTGQAPAHVPGCFRG
ncbi:DNA-3-methyladenine glycosylase I [Kocuria palustris]|uniref:DNA-3-methyladenine glycosylase I n=1 Tax=Kocuria palustris TaxID=71999 RepID=UPI00119FA62F|nr:DNA-3-methyladenine glycosylase I [Kocuria palustris]